MIKAIENSMQFQGKALSLRAERQQLLAANMANADTPGYKALDMNFGQALAEATGRATVAPLATSSASHIGAGVQPLPRNVAERVTDQPSADGNTVDMDKERSEFVDNAVRYEATLKFLNGKIRTLLSAIQGQ